MPYKRGLGPLGGDLRTLALTWSLSVQEAGRHYSDTWLYTDDDGARLLVERLGLRFAHVRTDLNALAGYDPQWWTLGKLHTLRLQTEPFFHIDGDVFLWRPLPEKLLASEVFGQHPNYFTIGSGTTYYRPEVLEKEIMKTNGWLPAEWRWFRANRTRLHGVCAGLLGGQRVEFLRYAAQLAFDIINHNENRAVWRAIRRKTFLMPVLEEFLMAACIEYHRNAATNSPFAGIKPAYLFENETDVYKPEFAVGIGYSHISGNIKHRRGIMPLVEQFVGENDPLQRCRCKNTVVCRE